MRRDPFASPAPEVKTESYFEREPPTPLYPRLPTVREQKEVPARNRYVAEEFYEEEDEDEESGAESQEEEEEEIPVSDPLAATKQFLRANYSRDDIKDMKTNQIRSLADAHQDLFPKKGDNKFNRGIGGRYGTDLEQMKREMVRRIWDR